MSDTNFIRKPLRLLHLEDNPPDGEIVAAMLEAEGIPFEVTRVETRSDFEAALARGGWDLILSDFALPAFDALTALALAKERLPHVPFILFSGTVGEERAVEALQLGATDYVVKQRPDRLPAAVRRAVREAREHAKRHQAEAALRASERYARNIFNSSLDMIIAVDEQRRITEFNPAAQRAFGYGLNEVLGQPVDLLYADAEEGREIHKATIVDGQCVREIQNRRHNGELFTSVLNASVLHNDAGELMGVMGISRDITERKRAEQALRDSELLFRSVWNGAGDGMRLTDKDGTIVSVNETYCRLVGLKAAGLEGQPFTVTYAGARTEAELLRKYRERFATGTIQTQLERRVTYRSGKTVDIDVINSFVQLEKGEPLLLGVFRDVTERRQLEAQLRQSQKLESVGQLAAGVAHDFNNILTVIQGHASLLLGRENLDAPMRKALSEITLAGERAANLNRQLLTFSRKQALQPIVLDLNAVVDDTAKLLQRVIGEDVALRTALAPKPLLTLADPGMIGQVLMNLAVNSRDAMPSGGQLRIFTKAVELQSMGAPRQPEARSGRFVCLTVRDTGCGMTPEVQQRIFEPFFTTKGPGKGTGLGLATVYGIVEQHHGWIEVESQPGHGTTFKVFLPASAAGVAPAEVRRTDAPVRGGSETVLIVEDEPSLRLLGRVILERQGYTVLEAPSGVAALEVCHDQLDRISLVLTDMVMPDGMTGRELGERLQAHKPGLKVIYTSGYSADVVGQDFVLEEGVNFLQKPYQPNKLAQIVRAALDSKN